jgi:hypothetical protein
MCCPASDLQQRGHCHMYPSIFHQHNFELKKFLYSLSSLMTVCAWWATANPKTHNLDDLNCRPGLTPGPPMCQASVLTLSYIPPPKCCVFSQFTCQKCKIHRLTGLFHERCFIQASFFSPCLQWVSTVLLMREKALVSHYFIRRAVLWV